MISGREIAGLPVFSWEEGTFLGRVEQCYLDLAKHKLGGVVMEKESLRRTRDFISAKAILKIYKDGIIVTAKSSIEQRKTLPKDGVFYGFFLQNIELPLFEGKVISDLFFDEKNRIVGGELSGGFWDDISEGRGFCTWRQILDNIKMQKNGR